jgi:hypothetical protein
MKQLKEISKILFPLILLSVFCIETSAFSQEKSIAKLADFSGIVLIKNKGAWGLKPAKNLPLYSMDKVVTGIGTATIVFIDGAVLDVKNNSNLLIREIEKSLIKKVKAVERKILLFLGKLYFKTGDSKVETRFETTKTVIGIKGAAGVLSIGSDGQIYITFTEGRAKFALGDLVHGKIAADVPTDLADQNPVQKASYLAHAAYEKCLEAKQKAARGEISSVQELWFCAKAREMAAREVKIWATALVKNNPYTEVVKWADETIIDTDKEIEDALEDQEDAVQQGAIPEPEDEYQPPEEEGEAEAYEPPEDEGENLSDLPIQDLEQDYEEEIPPISDDQPASSEGSA